MFRPKSFRPESKERMETQKVNGVAFNTLTKTLFVFHSTVCYNWVSLFLYLMTLLSTFKLFPSSEKSIKNYFLPSTILKLRRKKFFKNVNFVHNSYFPYVQSTSSAIVIKDVGLRYKMTCHGICASNISNLHASDHAWSTIQRRMGH